MGMQGLSAICAGLGFAEEDENGNRIGYTKGDQCLENIKDLLRFLRRDNPQTREVFKQVCKWSTVSKDLIPIIQFCQDDRNLVLNAVKVLVFLTMPIEPSSSDIPQQIDYLCGLKLAITYSDTVVVIVSLLEGPLENLASEGFTEDDWKLVQLVLTLFRNILAIQDMSTLQKIGGSACQFLMLRDRFLELLFQENVMDLIIVMTQQINGPSGYLRQDNLLLLEIFHYSFAGRDPELIAKARGNFKAGGDTEASLNCLKSIMEEEDEKRKFSRQHTRGRHSQLGGTFTRITMDGSKTVYKGKPSSASRNILLQKVQKAPVKKIVWDHGRLPAMKDNILVLLHDFVNQFLSGGYNALMQSIRDDIEKEHRAIQNSDVIIFFQVAQFVTSFQYHKFLTYKPNSEKDTACAFTNEYADSTYFKGDMCGPIAASMNESMFLLVVSRWRFAFDGLKETNNYKFLSAAGSLMKIMIRMLDLVLKILPEDSKEPQTARILLYKLFYDQTDEGMSQFLLSQIKSFDSHKQPKSDLADVVEMIHVIVRLMENLQSRGALRVSKKSRRARKNTPDDKKETGNELAGNEATDHDQTVHSRSEHLGMLERKCEEDASSGHKDTTSVAVEAEEPEIAMADKMNLDSNLPPMDERKTDYINNNLCCTSDDSSDDEQPTATTEVDFRVSTFVSTFANHSIIRNLCWLLRFYKSNSFGTNNYIIGMLHRITDDLNLSPMLYQLSLLKIFYEILDEQKSCPGKEYANIVDFLARLVRRMLRKMKSQPLLFVELLFWKSRRECHYINVEYLLQELGNMKKESKTWGNVPANGDFGSSQSTGWVPRSIADALGEDEADVVISHELGLKEVEENLGEVQKDVTSISSRSVEGKENSNHGGHTMGVEIEGFSRRKRRLVLTEELEIKIKDLYDKFKDSENCSQIIAEYLDPDGRISPAQVLNKLKHLGLKVASKKRKRHSDGPYSTGPHQPGEKGRILAYESELDNAVDLEESLRKQSLSTKKRTRAFSRDEEEKIKALYEKFRDNKKCSSMIANALAPDNSFTAAQVLQKLKQLGLCVPRRKKSEADVHLSDEEVNGLSVDGHDSDNETLLSLRNRTKMKDDGELFKELPKQNVEEELSGGSDDELLSSILRYKKKDDAMLSGNGQNKETDVLEDSDNRHSRAILRDGGNQPTGMDVEGICEHVALSDASKEEENSADDSLADSDDHAPSDTSPKRAILKRKLRMIIDPDDDDD